MALEMTKGGVVVQKKAYILAFRQFVKSVIGESWYGNVRVKLVAQHSNSRMLRDLQVA
jgi:hypothetical protein